MSWPLALVPLAGCTGKAEKRCDAYVERLHAVANRNPEACSPELACAELATCVDKHGCRILFAPGDVAQLRCW